MERRTVMKGVGAGVVGSLLPAAVVDAAGADTVTTLGDFEESLDHWKTNGGNVLERHAGDDWDRPVTSGDGALEVQANGDPYPMAYNRKRVRNADLVETPYLLADVTVGRFDDESTDLAFNFRYHHSAGKTAGTGGESGNGHGGKSGNGGESGNGNRGTSGNGNGGKSGQGQSPLVETSERTVVPQYVKTTLTWDLTEISKAKRRKPERIDVAWHAQGSEPKKGPSGRGPGAGLEGSVYFDNVRLVDSRTELAQRALARQLTRLKAKRGTLTYENETADVETLTERGRFVFDDGTEVDVEFTVEGDDKWRYTIAGETHELGGGWE